MGVATTYNPAGKRAARPSVDGEPESPFLPSPFVRPTAILLATLLAAPPAFSADSSGETTAPVGEASSTVVTPLRMTPELSGQRAPVREPIPAGTMPHVALILPLSSPSLGSVADAVRQGFLAAAEAAGRDA